MDTVLLLSLLAGFATGALATWVLARAQFRRELTESITTHQATVSAAQALFHQTTRRLGEVQGELVRARDDLDRARAEGSTLRESLARTSAELEHQHRILPQQMAVLEQAQTQLRESFQALAGSALKSSNEEFLKLAHERLSGLQKDASSEIARKHQAFDDLVAPIRDVLQQVDQKLGEVEKNRVETGAEISSLLEAIGRSQTQLRAETTNLVRALRTPTVRGRWGEMQLRRVVEMAGMLEYCDFDEQSTGSNDQGTRTRPDLLVRLPGGRTVVVDAKVPLEAYLDAQEATDEHTREHKLGDHARQVRDHMTKLGAKSYWEQFQPSPEFGVMFLPGEAIFQAAHRFRGGRPGVPVEPTDAHRAPAGGGARLAPGTAHPQRGTGQPAREGSVRPRAPSHRSDGDAARPPRRHRARVQRDGGHLRGPGAGDGAALPRPGRGYRRRDRRGRRGGVDAAVATRRGPALPGPRRR
jgi:DNA anti-recombination protein RmuC